LRQHTGRGRTHLSYCFKGQKCIGMGLAPAETERLDTGRSRFEAGWLEAIFSNCEQLPRCSLTDAAMRFPPLAAYFFAAAKLGASGLKSPEETA